MITDTVLMSALAVLLGVELFVRVVFEMAKAMGGSVPTAHTPSSLSSDTARILATARVHEADRVACLSRLEAEAARRVAEGVALPLFDAVNLVMTAPDGTPMPLPRQVVKRKTVTPDPTV